MKFIAVFVLGLVLIVGSELFLNRTFGGPIYDRTVSGISDGHEGGGIAGGGGHRYQTMPDWMRQLYDWIFGVSGNGSGGPYGGGGGGGF
jgi:hypothetical protein